MCSEMSGFWVRRMIISIMMPSVVAFGIMACPVLFQNNVFAQKAVAQDDITGAQPPLPTETLVITTKKGKAISFIVEKAMTAREQETGEMFRKTIPENHGMLFIWPIAHESAMWMKNTYVPLDIVFIDKTQHIHAIEENTIPLSEAIISSHGVVAGVLELPAGTTEKLGILVGDKVESPSFAHKPR